jgi:4'-phosphopantetheinyl transferase
VSILPAGTHHTHASDIGGPWRPAPARVTLEPGAVHLWKADVTRCDVRDAETTLSVDEWARAERYLLPEARDRFVAARLTLRRILAGYTETPAAALQFDYSPYGKPALRTVDGRATPAFNASHSGRLALYAFALDGPVGVDVEQIRPVSADTIVESYFSAAERTRFHGVPASDRVEIFHRWWALKEAYIKGIGTGHSRSLSSFDVLSGDGMDEGWSVATVACEPGYAAALAVCIPTPLVQFWIWEG